MSSFNDVIWKFCNLGSSAADTDEERVTKAILTLTALIIAFLAIFWGALYIFVGYPSSGAIPLSYAGISFASIVFFLVTKKFTFFRRSQLILILLLPFILMASLGGFANGSVVIIWAIFSPIAAIFFNDKRQATYLAITFAVLTIASGLLDEHVRLLAKPMDPTINTAFFVMNMSAGFLCLYLVLISFVKDRETANKLANEAKEDALAAQAKLEVANLQLKENELRIRELMLTDPLTGVANRRHWDDKVSAEFKRMKRTKKAPAIVIADIDHFKKINDAYGHDAGDHVLKDFANTLVKCSREVDFVARVGGEEFLILLPESTLDEAKAIVDRIREHFSRQQIDGLTSPVTASFGITVAKPEENIEACIKRADNALYQSKHGGRNRVTVAD